MIFKVEKRAFNDPLKLDSLGSALSSSENANIAFFAKTLAFTMPIVVNMTSATPAQSGEIIEQGLKIDRNDSGNAETCLSEFDVVANPQVKSSFTDFTPSKTIESAFEATAFKMSKI